MSINRYTPGTGRLLREDGSIANVADLATEMLGGKGMEVITDTAAHSPNKGVYIALQALEDATIDTIIADPSAPITGTLAGLTIPAGMTIYGRFIYVQLSSGKAIAYRGV